MSSKKQNIVGYVIAVQLAVAGLAWGQAPQPMTQVEQDGFLQWLHSLEQEVSVRQDSGISENHVLYPFSHEEIAVCDTTTPYRHLTIAKALGVLEAQFHDPRQAEGLSALVALANARNYVNLTEYDSSLIWFDAAAALDTAKDFTDEIKLESLTAAIAAEDSSRMVQFSQTIAKQDISEGDPLESILAVRWCLTDGDSIQLKALSDSLWSHRDKINSTQGYWLARTLHQLGRPARLYEELKNLIQNGGLSLGLTEDQRAWGLTTLADVSYQLGISEQAKKLYSTLSESPLENLRVWAQYQLAGMDLANGDYLAASTGFGSVCKAKPLGSWHDQACALEKAAQEMDRIRREGEPYGLGRFYKP